MGKMYFAKMNINEDIYQVYEGKKKIKELLSKIFSGISTHIDIYDDKGGRIKFFNLDISKYGYKLTGNLGYIKKGFHSSYDSDNDTAIDTEDDNKIEYITFYFDVDEEMLGYMTTPSLSRTKVLEYFSKLIKKGSSIGIEFIQESNIDNINNEIKEYSKISKLRVKIVPPNGDKEDFADLLSIDPDRLKESNTTKLYQDFQTQRKEGINPESELVKKYIYGTGLGYSEVTFSGKDKNNANLEISSSKHIPYKKDVPSGLVKDHNKIKDVAKSGIASINKMRSIIRAKLNNRKK